MYAGEWSKCILLKQKNEVKKKTGIKQRNSRKRMRLLLTNTQYPEFGIRNVAISVAEKAFGKDQNGVRAGIIVGCLPIGEATKNEN